MDNQFVQPTRMRSAKGRQDALKVLLVAGLSVQAWGLLMGLGLIILNLTH
ncbi:hypothetical protein [Asticcacaulis solisilvae]